MKTYSRLPKEPVKSIYERTSRSEMFTCDICKQEFTLRRNMLRHKRTHIGFEYHRCEGCSKTFKRKSNLDQHKMFVCRATMDTTPTKTKNKKIEEIHGEFTEVTSALKNRIKTFCIRPDGNGDIPSVLRSIKPKLVEVIISILNVFTAIKFNIFVECEFKHPTGESSLKNLKTRNVIVYRTSDIDNLITNAFNKIHAEKEECQLKGSGWKFHKIVKIELRINKFNPLRGANHIKLPKRIEDTKAVINVQNVDDYCFKYAILSKYCDSKSSVRVNNYINNEKLENKYDWTCVKYPVSLSDISKFEKVNNISINVFGLNDVDEVFPLKVCDDELADHTDLLYITKDTNSHYCYIRDFEKLVGYQKSKLGRRLKICKRCFAHFDNQHDKNAEDKFVDHKRLCLEHETARCEFPSYDSISFKNPHRSKKVRFVIYADFETLLKPIDNCKENPSTSWTNPYQKHVPYSYSYLLKDSEDEYTELREYRGPDAAKHFFQSIKFDLQLVDRILYGDKQLDVPTLSEEQQHEFDSAEVCHICKKGNFTLKNGKVRNHCHVSGLYLGAAHRHCNLFFQDQHFIPVFIHNLSGYDSHFIVRELGCDTNPIKVIPNTEEKYISFSKSVRVQHAKNNNIEVRFLDSFRFMPSSLSTLANNLPKDDFHETKKNFAIENLNLVVKKGCFPYDYMTDESKLQERALPPKSAFFSKLNETDVTDEMYEHAHTVWNEFNVKTLGEYSDIYLKTDVLILCDIFESFRKLCMETYDLDPAYYYTVPGLAFHAMLKYTGIELELLKDMDMLLMVEKGIRGGITQCIKRYSVANNKDLSDSYNIAKPSNYLWYIDANNLYGWAMSKSLPSGKFEWCDVSSLDVVSVSEDSDEGYILEVDLEYPPSLHDSHKDFPFCTETKPPPKSKEPKLLATVENKTKYVIHYIALQQALRHGLVLTKIHRAIKFKQSPWLKPFVDLNTEKRKTAKNDFEIDLFKLFVNSIYGKTMEQIRNRLDIRLVSDPQKAEKLIAKPNFIDRTVYNENLVGIHMGKTKLVFNKPIYIGMSILDISKYHMYSFHYDVMQPFYGEKIQLCYQDTNSFIYDIDTNDLYNDLSSLSEHLDTSNYPVNHHLSSSANKKVLGKFKDELGGDLLVSFVGLRSKMYAIKKKGSVIKKIKGIKKSVIKKMIHFGDYVKCLFKGKATLTENNQITSKTHFISTVTTNKVTLNRSDNKRVILDDRISTLPYGHWRLKEDHQMKKVKLEKS